VTGAALLPLAAALLAGEVPTAERLARLAPFFAPPPGSEVTLDARELRDLGKTRKVAPGRLRGWITVTPPQGVCLTVRRPGQGDEEVCRRRRLSFQMDDLDKAGRLKWTVVTGAGDFGTELAWRSLYRVAVVTPDSKKLEDQPDYRYLGACDASDTPAAGRRIRLALLSGETWTVHLPDRDRLLPQPEAIPNLQLSISGGKTSVKDAEKDKKEKKADGEAPAESEAAPNVPSQFDDRSIWAIPLRGAYAMSADGFVPFSGLPHGLKGECRYNYQGPADDPETGRLECHDADGFKAVFLPLTCLKDLRQSPIAHD
jgi:hypothetical protein